MMRAIDDDAGDGWTADLRTRMDELLDEYRTSLHDALDLDAVVHGRGSRPVWALQLQVLRELAQHAGHADILREQILGQRAE